MGIAVFPYQAFPAWGRRPEGADRVLAVWKRARESVSSTPLTRAPYPPLARSPFPKGEGYDTGMSLFSHCQNIYTHMWKNNNDGQSLPRVGKVPRRGG